jgi:hypothetical protein
MSKMDEIKRAIEGLTSEGVAEIYRCLAEKDWGKWDMEIEADSQTGRLEFLTREAGEEKVKGTLKDL